MYEFLFCLIRVSLLVLRDELFLFGNVSDDFVVLDSCVVGIWWNGCESLYLECMGEFRELDGMKF